VRSCAVRRTEKYKKTELKNRVRTEKQKKLIENRLSFLKNDLKFFIPSSYCEKYLLYFGELEDWITIYKIENNKDIKHPDVLGTLFSIGYNQELIGDIFVEENTIYITNLTKMNSYLEENLKKIKNHLINLEKTKSIELTKERFESIILLLTSMRLDHVVSKIMNTSRSVASEKIKNGDVLVNYQVIKKQDFFLKINDVLSIRSVGKFIIFEEQGKTKNQKQRLEIKKYM